MLGEGDFLSVTPGDVHPLTAAAHPVTRVYCNESGIVCYERMGAEPLLLNSISPKRSRVEALRRCVGLLDSIPDENSIERNMTISLTGVGLTYNQLKMQTFQACGQSKQIEAKRREELSSRR